MTLSSSETVGKPKPTAESPAGDNPAESSGASDSRLAVARRLYTYGVALVSYLVTLAALNALLKIIDQSWLLTVGDGGAALYTANFGVFHRDALASNGGLLLVAVPLFLIHWGYAQSLVRRDPEEAGAGMRKFFLYIAHAAAMIYGLLAFHRLLVGFGTLAVGAPLADNDVWPSGWLHAGLVVGLSFALARYWLAVVQSDGDFGREEDIAGFWRRLYQTAVGLIGLGLMIFGGAEMIQAIWQAFMNTLAFTAGDLLWRVSLLNGLGTLIVGVYVTRLNWQLWQEICHANPREQSRGLRRFYLYGAIVIGALATLVPAAGLLEEILRILLGVGTGDRWQLLNGLGRPVSLIPLGIAAWIWYWRYLKTEEASAPASNESETIRRVYYYSVAFTGLILLWFGAVEIVQAGLDRLFITPSASTADFWIDGLARGISLLSVGAPVWAFHWRVVERVARRRDETGRMERVSGPRRVYLYGVALIGALLILVFLAQVAYRGFLWLLGDPNAGFLSPQAASDLARSAIAAVLWIVHIQAIRTDGKLGTRAPAPAHTPVSGPDLEPARAALTTRIQRLEAELAAARAELAQLETKPPDA
ncbi:MAG: DUF5671 domain-containing protein [Litorilinea sp.]